MVAGSKRRSAEHLDIKPLEYFRDLCKHASNRRDACLIALLFLSGRRISEILHLKKQDIQLSGDYLIFKTFNLKAYRHERKGNKSIPIGNREFKIERDGRFYPEIEIALSRESDAYRMLGEYVEHHLQNLRSDDYVFYRFRGQGFIGRKMCYHIVRALDPSVWLHWFRHQRFTNVYQIIKENVSDPSEVIMDLHDFTKHRNINTTLNYIHRVESQEIKRKI